jgi:hypothetical protein
MYLWEYGLERDVLVDFNDCLEFFLSTLVFTFAYIADYVCRSDTAAICSIISVNSTLFLDLFILPLLLDPDKLSPFLAIFILLFLL